MNDNLMGRVRRTRARALAVFTSGILAGSVLATAPILGATASALAAPADISPGTVCAGSTTTFTLTVSVPSKLSGTGVKSVGLASSGFTLGSIVSSTAGTGTVVRILDLSGTNAAPGISTPDGKVLLLGGLNLSGTQTASVTFSATTVPSSSGSWGVYFEGDTQDGPFYDPEGGEDFHVPVLTTVATGCHLVFTSEPASAVKTQIVTNSALDPSGPSVKVQVQDGSYVPVPLTGPVSVSLVLNKVEAGLSGGSIDGTATAVSFPALQVANGAVGLTLTGTVTSPLTSGIASGTSTHFDIYDQGATCGPTGCSLDNLSNSNTPGSSFKVVGSTGGFIAASVNPNVVVDCTDLRYGGYAPIPGTSTLAILSTTTGKQVTITIAKELVKTVLSRGVGKYMVCFSAPGPNQGPAPFIQANGQPAAFDQIVTDATGSTDAGFSYYTGLLPDCGKKTTIVNVLAPCVASRNKTQSGTMLVTFLAPPGDPHSR